METMDKNTLSKIFIIKKCHIQSGSGKEQADATFPVSGQNGLGAKSFLYQ